jgi:hypothetical protein
MAERKDGSNSGQKREIPTALGPIPIKVRHVGSHTRITTTRGWWNLFLRHGADVTRLEDVGKHETVARVIQDVAAQTDLVSGDD